MKIVAIVATVLDAAIFMTAVAIVLISDDIDTIVFGDLLAAIACVLAALVLRYWAQEGHR